MGVGSFLVQAWRSTAALNQCESRNTLKQARVPRCVSTSEQNVSFQVWFRSGNGLSTSSFGVCRIPERLSTPFWASLAGSGAFWASGWPGGFHPLPEEIVLWPLDEKFRRRVIALLVDQELLPRDRAEMLLSWQHSGTDLAAATLGQIRLKLFQDFEQGPPGARTVRG